MEFPVSAGRVVFTKAKPHFLHQDALSALSLSSSSLRPGKKPLVEFRSTHFSFSLYISSLFSGREELRGAPILFYTHGAS